jgi:hypothetical protein
MGLKKNRFCSVLLFAGLLVGSFSVKAQYTNQHSGWLAWFNTMKLSPKVGLSFDGQLRSADRLSSVKNVLIRPGFTYFFDNTKNATLGYAFILTNQDPVLFTNDHLIEHRIWQQFIYNAQLGKIPLVNRFRLEQRFIELNSSNVFSQRFRYFIRSVIPVQKQNAKPFSKGMFIALQNEIFLNIQNKEQLNNKFFDQNRAYLASGYRVNSTLDLEAGYLNQYLKGKTNTTSNHVIQLALYTRFK